MTRIYGQRLERARALMHRHGVDFLLVGPSADLLYLLGLDSRQSERMTLLILPQEAPAFIVLPQFEAPLLPELPPGLQVHTWGETDNPARIAASLVASGTHTHPGGLHCTLGVSDRLWSLFLLQLQSELPRAQFIASTQVLAAVRLLKDDDEARLLRESGAVADQVFSMITEQTLSGRTEIEVAQKIQRLLEAGGLHVPGAPIVASGPNSASPHHHAGNRVIEPGDAIVLDFGGTKEGYYSDITRTVFVGSRPAQDSEQALVYNLVAEAQEAARKAARPGMTCEQLDAVARTVIEAAGYGEYFNHRLGHGIGLDGHESPYIVSGNKTPLRKGMAFSIEPGVYLPGKFGVRIEDIVVMEDDGARSCNEADRGLAVVK